MVRLLGYGAGEVAAVLRRVRALRPAVPQVANVVTAADVSNATHAVGALPVLLHAREELPHLLAAAGVLVLNAGAPTPERYELLREAGVLAAGRRIPIVLDPVGAGASPWRTRELLALLGVVRPSVLRANAGEVAGLAAARGLAASVEEGEREALATALARDLRCVVVMTGPVDWITDGTRAASIANGHPLMAAVAGLGCMASAVAGACLAVEPDPFAAALAALTAVGVAGELAAAVAHGPGSFKPAFFDALHRLDEPELRAHMRVASR